MVIREINMLNMKLGYLVGAFERKLSVSQALHLRVICLVILHYKQINSVWQSREA